LAAANKTMSKPTVRNMSHVHLILINQLRLTSQNSTSRRIKWSSRLLPNRTFSFFYV